MKMKEKIKGIVRAIRSVFLFFSLLLNPDIQVGARQKLLYNLNDPHKVVSEYYRKNLEMLCLATGVSSAAIVMVIVLAHWLIRRRRR